MDHMQSYSSKGKDVPKIATWIYVLICQVTLGLVMIIDNVHAS